MVTNNDCISKLALDVLNLSKNTLVINLRFMDRAISILRPTSIEEMNGIAVDGINIYYDPLYVIKAFNKESMLMNRQYAVLFNDQIIYDAVGELGICKLSGYRTMIAAGQKPYNRLDSYGRYDRNEFSSYVIGRKVSEEATVRKLRRFLEYPRKRLGFRSGF